MELIDGLLSGSSDDNKQLLLRRSKRVRKAPKKFSDSEDDRLRFENVLHIFIECAAIDV